MLIEIFRTLAWHEWLFLLGGLALIGAEMLIPGFGICGIAGIIILGVFIATAATTIGSAVLLTSLVVVLVAVEFLLFYFLFLKKMPSRIKLSDSLNQNGNPNSENFSKLVGCHGKSLTTLRPAGLALLDGKRYDVMTAGEYVPAGEEIVVIGIEGNRITVRQEKN